MTRILTITALTLTAGGFVAIQTLGMEAISRDWPRHYCAVGNILPCDDILRTEWLPRGVSKLTADGKIRPEFGGAPWPTHWTVGASVEATLPDRAFSKPGRQ
jgi:hypothetical protein